MLTKDLVYHLKVAILDENLAVGKSENLVMLHPYDLTQPSFRGCSDLAFQTRCLMLLLDFPKKEDMYLHRLINWLMGLNNFIL